MFLTQGRSRIHGELTKDLSSTNIFAPFPPSISTHIIRNLYLIAFTFSTAIPAVMNSDPNVDDSKVFYFLLYHEVRDIFRKIRIPVWDPLVTLFSVWSAS